jgi:putative tryptophan/tyrosine transport system substrate-binding protein
MRRREVLALATAAMWVASRPSLGQPRPTREIARLGYLGTGAPIQALVEAFEQGLRDLGWIVGKDLIIEYRFAEGHLERLPALAAELVGLNVQAIAASPTPAALAAKAASNLIPIVGISFDNPIEHGLVRSLAQPGGNITGLAYSVGPEIFAKDLELLRELVPYVRRIAVLSGPFRGVNRGLMLQNVSHAARGMGLELSHVEAMTLPGDFNAAFVTMEMEGAQALLVFGDPAFSVHATQLTALAAEHRVPALYTNRPFVEAGGLMSYAPNFPEIWRRAAAYVDKILKGARPAELPVEQPTKFELVINLKTAKALRLSIPHTLLARADEVIERGDGMSSRVLALCQHGRCP